MAECRRFCRHGEIMVGFVLVSQFPCFIFANKVKQLKIDLKRSNKEVLKNVEENKRFLMEEIPSLDYLEEDRSLIEEKRVSRAKAKADLENVALVQEGSWRQKSKENWLNEGDHNTVFFTALPTLTGETTLSPILTLIALLHPIKRRSMIQSFNISRISFMK